MWLLCLIPLSNTARFIFSHNVIRPLLVSMGSIEEYILKIKIPTNNVKMEDIQELLKKFKALNGSVTHTKEFKRISSEVVEILWLHLKNGFEEFDDQLLCSTFFYTVLTFANNKEHYFNNILEQINDEIDSKISRKNISVTISMMYGIFQSSIIIQELDNSYLAMILNRTFNLVTSLAYEYSQYTFIVFKIMTFFKKVICTNYQDIIFNEECNLKLLNVINHNWENPINGIRNLNKVVFGNLITAIDEKMHEFILKELNIFYWNKAKYLMLSEIIEQHHSDIMLLISKCRLREGLIYSLNKPGLVSAGADMYIAIVKKINTDEEWCTIFSDIILETFKSASIKPIENFINYWCLNTFKLFPSLVNVIFSKVETLNFIEHKLFACLSLMQQSYRLGLLEKKISSNQLEELVFNGIVHIDAKIRAISFDIICSSQRKYLNNQNIYNIILDFIKNNVSSDCSVLRISMINSLQKLLLQNHRTFANNFRCNKADDIETSFLEFCTELQLFIIESLNLNGNYQRKITTVQILKTILKSFTEVPRKNQKQPPLLHVTLINFLINRNNWLLLDKKFVTKLITLLKDPSDDIRENVMFILLQNYPDQLCESNFMKYLTEDALTCIRSKFFYQISCGHTILKLILNLLLIKRDTEGQFKKVEDIFEFAYEALKLEFDTKTEIVKSIDEGKQLHSYLSILYNVFEVCLAQSYKLKISMFTLNSLLDMLESISNQFAWEEEGGSSDFSKMNLMVHEIIANSEHQRRIKDNETNISGLHQIVLNCLWLNVKASCTLSSILIKYYRDDNHTDVCKKCLNIICNVLETSRHKGAIEAGGTALGEAIQTLTSLSEEYAISKIPMDLLKNKLNDLISETSNMASVTRRGAGLSIMVHRIVSSDMKKGKPLFHFFMGVLLETFTKLNNSEQRCTDKDVDGNNERDLPKAIYIHFLTRIVIDSSLASDVLFYSANLAEIAFGNLTDSCWQIRNAALQLYGSLIPKLIGQKKKSGENEEVMATVAVDEFRTHSPKLWKYIVEELKYTNRMNDAIQSHNNLVPILSVIANMAPKYDFNYTKEIDVMLLPSLISLLESPIYVVRRLTAKCLLNIYTFEVILNYLLNCKYETENCLHGTLLLLNDFIKQYKTRDDLNNNVEIIKCKYSNIMKAKHHSYLCRERFEQAFPSFLNMTKNMITETLLEITENKIESQGLFLWANHRIKMSLEYAEWDIIPEIIMLLIDSSDFETYGAVLCDRLQNDRCIPEDLLLKLFNTLYSWGFKKKSTVIWKIMYKISLKTELVNEQIDINILHRYLEDNQISYGMRYILPLAARLFKDDENKEILAVSKHILKLCNPETSDADMRLVAAMVNNELAKKYRNLLDDTKINITIAAIMFLQDEDEDTRNCSVHFYRLINEYEKETHPYICLKYILTHDFLIRLFGNCPALISSFHSRLLNLLQSLTVCNEDDYNPFISDSKNIYLEPEVIKQLLLRIQF